MNKTTNQALSITTNGKLPRIAIIGCGAIVESYYMPALSRHPRVLESITLVDQDIDRAKKLAAAFNGNQIITDYHEILNKTDGVIIAVPTHLHHPIAMDFLSRGIPVLCEKPLAEVEDKAFEMVDLANNKGVALATNYSQRLWAHFTKVKEIIASRNLGEPLHINYNVGEVYNWPTVSGFSFNTAGSKRGVLLDRGAHILDHICWWLGGKPEVIYFQNDSFGGCEAVAHVQFKYQKCLGDIRISWLSKFPCTFDIELEHGSIEGEVYYPQSILVKSGNYPKKRIKLTSVTYSGLAQLVVDNFINVLAGKEKPLVPASDVLNSIRFTDDCYANATSFNMPWYEIQEKKND